MEAMCVPVSSLVCFAVSQEARPFERLARGREDVRTVVTGMGAKNACVAVKRALAEFPAGFVATCGFAGGLNPHLAAGTLLFAGTPPPGVSERLQGRGARLGSFYLSDQVAVTAAEKSRLWRTTGSDAVEMESLAVATICLERKIPCLILRVILDEASEDLPLDFNQLVDAELKMDAGKLARSIAAAPWKIPGLLRLQRRSSAAAGKLAGALTGVLDLIRTRCGMGDPKTRPEKR